MIFYKIIGGVVALCLTTFATAGDINVAAATDIQTISIGFSDTGRNPDDMADFLAVVTDALADSNDDQYDRNPDSLYQRHVGLGFALGMSKGNPLNSECNGNGHLGDPDGNGNENHSNGNGHRDCGEPSPSD